MLSACALLWASAALPAASETTVPACAGLQADVRGEWSAQADELSVSMLQRETGALSLETPSKVPRHAAGTTSRAAHRDPTSSLEQLRVGVCRSVGALADERGYKKNMPVVVSFFDQHYGKYLTPWASRLRAVGLPQLVVITLDEETKRQGLAAGLPIIADDAISTPSLLQWGAPGSGDRLVPENLATFKFLVPECLLQSGFEVVVVSEADVFIYHYFMDVVEASVDLQGGELLAMRTSPITEDINIGFMIFRGQAVAGLLDRFLHRWFASRSENKTVVAIDQVEFNEFLNTDKGLRPAILPEANFAVKPSQGHPGTVVVHLAWSSPACKFALLDKLYPAAGPPSPPESLPAIAGQAWLSTSWTEEYSLPMDC